MANDVAILELMRRMRADDQTLCGQYLITYVPCSREEGVITSVVSALVVSEPTFLAYGNHSRLYLNQLAEAAIWIVLAPTKLEVRKIYAARQATS